MYACALVKLGRAYGAIREAIGVWAPILLVALRIVQGFAAGGEWGTSTAFMVEWAPQNRRGLFGSFQQVSTAGGSLLGSAVAAGRDSFGQGSGISARK